MDIAAATVVVFSLIVRGGCCRWAFSHLFLIHLLFLVYPDFRLFKYIYMSFVAYILFCGAHTHISRTPHTYKNCWKNKASGC